jgi:predicted HTH domain antitoxin
MKFALACGLLAMGEADSGSAAEIAGMGRLDFLDAYGRHGMQRPYHSEDLTDDIAFLRHR